MALSEFAAMEAAYQALQALDPAARGRAVRWLTDALSVSDALPALPASDETASAPAAGGRGRGSGSGSASPAAAPAGRSRGSRRAAAAGPRQPARRGRAAKATADDGEGRAYRRMPPAEEVLAAYQQAGSLSGLAEHYQVPRHTIQGWASRLRRQGHPIGRNA
jgi:hypothetical protein